MNLFALMLVVAQAASVPPSAPVAGAAKPAAAKVEQKATFVRMEGEHVHIEKGIARPFADVPECFSGHLVFEISIDCENLKAANLDAFIKKRDYAVKSLIPLMGYVAIPEKKIKDKSWLKFRNDLQAVAKNFPFPVYVDAGIDLPAPKKLPWYRLVDHRGVIVYDGEKYADFDKAYQKACKALPKPDPMFVYAKPVLLKDFVDGLVKAKTAPPKILKALEMEERKAKKAGDAEREIEAKALVLGMKQSVERNGQIATKMISERPGRAFNLLKDLTKMWPEAVSHPVVIAAQRRLYQNPDVEKLAKCEKTLEELKAWQPTKSADIKKKDAEKAALRKKLEKFSKSQLPATEGEAMTMLSELESL